jgi:hypothetical protein
MRDKEKEIRKVLGQQKNRTLKQSEKQKMISDFMKYIDILIQVYRLAEKLDAAGDTLTRIFKSSIDNGKSFDKKAMENFRNWIVNFDVWGSFLPLTAQSWDIQLARAAAYEKLSIFRASLRDLIRHNRNSLGKSRI